MEDGVLVGSYRQREKATGFSRMRGMEIKEIDVEKGWKKQKGAIEALIENHFQVITTGINIMTQVWQSCGWQKQSARTSCLCQPLFRIGCSDWTGAPDRAHTSRFS
eukprot:TRINITY_DN1646_c0_g1_i12.p1 TRINITY_DN1646_c0_g1~~TRINITY_DN1646_c0_g1_i12.p1  ORF type:complete len:106 (+),score=4.50 TRINITY_DN1646_c0_g1_i12:31-348(+)